jgi:hypothetical protein
VLAVTTTIEGVKIGVALDIWFGIAFDIGFVVTVEVDDTMAREADPSTRSGKMRRHMTAPSATRVQHTSPLCEPTIANAVPQSVVSSPSLRREKAADVIKMTGAVDTKEI